ncbi:DUF3153 domain-containing protein [Hoyosella rhizosphaerae]|uniref:LppM domain-containing protein n=1 Tax=Hoyosella rhizosphaerae TaxID=1755582 RepID=A0A916UHF4_9ACTN|nr:DUF3153 domain-containing protein [Hoyosella rhizosphaerae]MBN4927928.1 DUF3153 domain-containing protein [Hoyosella rhizosphaerae]GGC71057.1 hypothetical protein GCM10011410_24960 [Hoyosella rhizosphaerae]
MPDSSTPHYATPIKATRRRAARIAPAALLLVSLTLLLTGCLRTDISLSISEDDRVSGRIVVAQLADDEESLGPQLRVQDSLRTRVRVQPWAEDGYVGSDMVFNGLSFADLRQLALSTSDVPGNFDVRLVRSGSTVSLTGRADLRNAPEGSDARVSVTFPSNIAATNGEKTSGRTVTWNLAPGELTTLRAEATYTDPNTRSFAGWAGFMISLAVAAAVVVGALAWFNRDRSPKPSELMH